ncbi:MAG: diguanylate cyclase [Acidobacteriota bacterium]
MSQNGKSRILIVEDSRSVREEIRQVLQEAGVEAAFYEAENGLDGFKIMMDHPLDLVFCDLVMPQMDGLKFLQLRLSREEMQEVPVVMLTAVGDVDQKIKVLSAGANDYITKPFHPGELVARAKVHLKVKQLQDELRQKNALLMELSTTDSLTKIYNRRHFLDLARREMERSERLGLQAALMIFDVDHFKGINDRFGHQLGDLVLVEICNTVGGCLRDYDIFGRYGGDEFTLLFPQTSITRALKTGERIEEAVQELVLKELPGERFTISGGMVSNSTPSEDLESLLRRADQALYLAKSEGRARVVCLEH